VHSYETGNDEQAKAGEESESSSRTQCTHVAALPRILEEEHACRQTIKTPHDQNNIENCVANLG
jgi:hypothetical protein